MYFSLRNCRRVLRRLVITISKVFSVHCTDWVKCKTKKYYTFKIKKRMPFLFKGLLKVYFGPVLLLGLLNNNNNKKYFNRGL